LQPPPLIPLTTQPSSFTIINILLSLLESMSCEQIKIINDKFILDLSINWINIKKGYLNAHFWDQVDQAWNIPWRPPRNKYN